MACVMRSEIVSGNAGNVSAALRSEMSAPCAQRADSAAFVAPTDHDEGAGRFAVVLVGARRGGFRAIN
jgi:hypothetical protein